MTNTLYPWSQPSPEGTRRVRIHLNSYRQIYIPQIR